MKKQAELMPLDMNNKASASAQSDMHLHRQIVRISVTSSLQLVSNPKDRFSYDRSSLLESSKLISGLEGKL